MSGKPDAMRKRLVSAGLTTEACSRYVEVFRAFISARLTRSRFEDELLKVLPREKIHVHNEIIQDIFFHAQQRRDGLRDLPVVVPLKDRRPTGPRREKLGALTAQAPIKAENKLSKVGHKRPREDLANGTIRTSGVDESPSAHPVKKMKRAPSRGGTEISDRPRPPKPKAPEKPSPKVRRRPVENTPKLPPPSPISNASAQVAPAKMVQSYSPEIATYDGMPYYPMRPGQAIDIDLFLRLRQRMKRIAIEQLGLVGVKDEAVGALVDGVEQHVKSLMEAGTRQRRARDGWRPHGNLQCGPVRGYDVRESALRNSSLLGDEAGMDLERLLMLL